MPITNAMTVDVEEHFQVSAFEPHLSRAAWDAQPSRVEANVERILALFAEAGVEATFFMLGWLAERRPALARRIAEAGHEIASHGFQHVRVSAQSRREFSEDVRRTKGLLEDASGAEVRGFRAASFSIGRDQLWALDALAECGYRYSSSVYPVRHDHYGMPEAPRFAFRRNGTGVLEVPITTVAVAGRNLPCGGGGYFRLLPYALSRWAIARVNGADGEPAVFYFHPWEVDPGQPRPAGLPLKTRFRHYLNLGRMERRLARLLGDFAWGRMDRIFLDEDAIDDARPPQARSA